MDASDPVIAPQSAVKRKDQIIIAKENLNSVLQQNYSLSLKGKVGGSSNTISERSSTRKVTGNTTTNSNTLLVSSQEIPSSSSKQVSTNSVQADSDCKIRRSLSSSNLLTNRFSSLESSDEDDDASLPDGNLDPKENMSPLGKVFL